MIEMIKSNIPYYVAYFIAILGLIHLFIIYFILRREIIQDLRGRDKKWNLKELSAIAWLVICPTTIIANILGVTIQQEVWITIDLWYMANLGSNNFDNYINQRYGKQVDKEPEKEEQVN